MFHEAFFKGLHIITWRIICSCKVCITGFHSEHVTANCSMITSYSNASTVYSFVLRIKRFYIGQEYSNKAQSNCLRLSFVIASSFVFVKLLPEKSAADRWTLDAVVSLSYEHNTPSWCWRCWLPFCVLDPVPKGKGVKLNHVTSFYFYGGIVSSDETAHNINI